MTAIKAGVKRDLVVTKLSPGEVLNICFEVSQGGEGGGSGIRDEREMKRREGKEGKGREGMGSEKKGREDDVISQSNDT